MARPKKQLKLKEPIRLREKKLVDGNRSLYLDIYHRGTRKYEYLKLYLVPENTPDAKERNKETMKVAEQIKAERILALQSRGLEGWESIKKSSMPMVVWLEKEYENPSKVLSDSSKNCRKQVRKMFGLYLESIHKPGLSLEEVDKSICRGFIAYLRTATNRRATNQAANGTRHITQTTGQKYMMELNCSLNYAVREGLISSNPFKQIQTNERLTRDSKEREFLTIDEIKDKVQRLDAERLRLITEITKRKQDLKRLSGQASEKLLVSEKQKIENLMDILEDVEYDLTWLLEDLYNMADPETNSTEANNMFETLLNETTMEDPRAADPAYQQLVEDRDRAQKDLDQYKAAHDRCEKELSALEDLIESTELELDEIIAAIAEQSEQ